MLARMIKTANTKPAKPLIRGSRFFLTPVVLKLRVRNLVFIIFLDFMIRVLAVVILDHANNSYVLPTPG
jgi:hypothetical protein